ncbi:voltage-gated potassium channel [Punctularia strigosozonata HHB-11173 SS5]|uniref:voltage-gated potassium channel n=1 Tax=Punctularia strigosozonata (strain HHB-11173) TaxID=741275 RepID=UPI0004416A93|nr:voltage-gated potassium channel [Punctularia strigosozonata HHB-11173 SS5]EIN12884.1 voltage-gated potassium channel [Punctularia strigosozonata HHB-11173 SS5]
MPRPIPLNSLRTSVSAQFLTETTSPAPANPDDDWFPHSFHDDEPDTELRPGWKQDLYMLLERPTSSNAAFFVHVFITFLIVLSSLVTVFETVPAFHTISGRIWFGFETSMVALFTVEYIARCIARSSSVTSFLGWVISFFGIIDLLAILPYYIEIALQQDTSVFFRFSILRTFRLLRVFRPFRYNNTILLFVPLLAIILLITIEVMYLSFRRSQHALLALSFFVVMMLTVFSTLLYFAERGTWDNVLETFVNADGDPSQFSSIPAAAWFVLVTITTVGYGEIIPRSFLGRLITIPLLVFGLLLIALPSFVLGREFSIVWARIHGRSNQLDDQSAELAPASLEQDGLGRNGGPSRVSDLSNRKLAQNQTELSHQITELRATVEAQGEMLERLVAALEAGGGGGSRIRHGYGEQPGEDGILASTPPS